MFEQIFSLLRAVLTRQSAQPVVPEPAAPEPGPIPDPAAFFAALRPSPFKKLNTSQVKGIEAKLRAMHDAAFPLAYAAYALATSYHETAYRMQPIAEYGKGKGRKYGKPGKHGQVAYGRGDVQLTWDFNYEKADKELGLNGALLRNYDLALSPDISAKIMVRGMKEGWFTGKALRNYLPSTGQATFEMFRLARRIINGTDRDAEIALIAMKFQSALAAGGWR